MHVAPDVDDYISIRPHLGLEQFQDSSEPSGIVLFFYPTVLVFTLHGIRWACQHQRNRAIGNLQNLPLAVAQVNFGISFHERSHSSSIPMSVLSENAIKR